MIWSEERSSQMNWNERNSTVWTEDKVEEFTFWDEMQCLFREVWGESHSTKLRICKLSLNLISCSGWVFLRQERWSVGKLPAGIDGRSETEKVTNPPSEAAERLKLRMVFPQQKHSQGEQWESSTTHLLCRRHSDVPECSLADLWPCCGMLLIHFHLHTCIGGPTQEIR